MSLTYEWIDENQYLNQYVPYNDKNGKVSVYIFDSNKNEYNYKFCYYIPIETVPQNAIPKSAEQTSYSNYAVQQQSTSQQVVQQQSTTQQVEQLQYTEQSNNMYSLTLQDGSQMVLDQGQTITYLYNLASQALQKITELEKSVLDETTKNTTLTQQLEAQQQFSEQLYKVNQNLTNEYYKLQQQQLMKAEHNNLNKKIDNLNKRARNNNKSNVEQHTTKEPVIIKEESVKEPVVKEESDKEIVVKEETKVKYQKSWADMSDEESESEDNSKKSYAEIISSNTYRPSTSEVNHKKYDDSVLLTGDRRSPKRVESKHYDPKRNLNNNPRNNFRNKEEKKMEEDGWEKVGENIHKKVRRGPRKSKRNETIKNHD